MSNNISQYKIIFFGTPQFAATILEFLYKNQYNIIAVVCQPDKPVGRKQELHKPETKIFAEKNNIPIFQPEKITQEFIDQIKSLKPDLILTAAYGFILPKELLDIPKFGSINIHASLLPKYRGSSPIAYAILNGDPETGITLIKMDEKMDSGPIIAQESIEIDHNDTTGTLHDKLAVLGSKLASEALLDWFLGKITPKEQNPDLATFAPKLTKDSGHINWNQPAVKVDAFIRAMNPWPESWSLWNNKRIKIIRANIHDQTSDVSGDVGRLNELSFGKVIQSNDDLLVVCRDGALKLEILQLEGKKEQGAKEFLNGHKEIVDAVLE